jgi:hypothetical protein
MQALEPVRVRDCSCPNKPHEDGDIVYVSPTLPMRGGLVANRQAIARATEVASGKSSNLEDDWLETFVRYGSLAWNLLDAQGDSVPFDVELILADYSMARLIAEKANDLGYGDAVMAPFLRTPAKPSRNGRTPGTTSARRRRTPTPSE